MADDDLLERRPVEITEDERRRREAALAQVSQWGDPVLRAATREVTRFDHEISDLAARMSDLMQGAIGCGLAAPQVGSLRRMFVYQADREAPITAVVNPVITWRSEEEESDFEGCLSLRDVVVEVSRPVAVRVEAADVDGQPLLIEAEGFEARVIQHEYDHLEGVLIIDRASREDRREALRQLADGAQSDPVA